MKRTTEKKILEKITRFFVESSDFNGIPLREICNGVHISYEDSIDLVKELIITDQVSIQSSTNPHIIGFKHHQANDQIKLLDDAKLIKPVTTEFMGVSFVSEDTEFPICVYPSPSYLEKIRDLNEFGNAYYTKRLALAGPQLKLYYFDIEVLERYANDPRYEFRFDDYSGKIYCKYDSEEQPLVRKEDELFLKSFGLGYDEKENRLAVVTLRYLKDLSPEHQVYWRSKEVMGNCKVVDEYYENIILGNWTFSYSIFSGFMGEQNCLNALAKQIFGKPLFLKSFDSAQRPRQFTFFFTPTRKNYLDFVLLLDQMISDNINKDFFKDKVKLEEVVQLKGGVIERKQIGTLRIFEEWLKSQYKTQNDTGIKKIFDIFRRVRKERQTPAHQITENEYNTDYNELQLELITECYHAMKALRYSFSEHRQAAGVDIPDWLENGRIIPF